MNAIILQFKGSVSERKVKYESVQKISGLIPLKYITKLIGTVSLKANPRQAKQNSTVNDIIESISGDRSLFHYKSKGVLLSSEKLSLLESNGNKTRCRIEFNDEDYEGILDGGHTTFSIGKYIIGEVFGNDSKEFKRIKTWDELKEVWNTNIDVIEEMVNKTEDDEEYIEPFLVPVEILYKNTNEPSNEAYFNAIYEIACARNNNTQLTQMAKDNKLGHYDIMRDNLSESLASRVAWRSGEDGIEPADLISLSLIPLSRCHTKEHISPSLMYNGKTNAAKLFTKIVTNPNNNHKLLVSAMKIMGDIVESYEYLYIKFPKAYNRARPGFGQISCVKMKNYKDNKGVQRSRKLVTKFDKLPCEYNYPHALIAPLFWSVSVLIDKKKNKNELEWKVDPKTFIDHLLNDKEFMVYYAETIKEVDFNPNKYAKRTTIYENLMDKCELIMLKYFK
jgi:hypothetical protein